MCAKIVQAARKNKPVRDFTEARPHAEGAAGTPARPSVGGIAATDSPKFRPPLRHPDLAAAAVLLRKYLSANSFDAIFHVTFGYSGDFCYICPRLKNRRIMADKSLYDYRVEPQEVDFTLRMRIAALGAAILNTAGIDAHRKGFGVDALNAGNHSWVLSRMALEFDLRPEQYADYTVATWISDYGRVLSTRNFTLTDAAGNQFGRAVSQWAMIDLEHRTAVDLSWVGREHAEAVVAIPSPTEKPRKIRAVNPSEVVRHRVAYSDIDFNRHVNTMRYIEMMLDMLPPEQLTCEAPIRMDLHFLHECRYGQTLEVGCERRERAALFEIGDGEGTTAVRASIEWK